MRHKSAINRRLLAAGFIAMAMLLQVFSLAPAGAKLKTSAKDVQVATQTVPTHWAARKVMDEAHLAVSPDFSEGDWWKAFQDSHLNFWIEIAMKDNPDLAVVEYRAQEARAMVTMARSPLFPSLSTSNTYVWQRYSKNEFLFPLKKQTFHTFRLPLQASYELDLFGRNLDAYRAEKSRYQASRLRYMDGRRVLAGFVASAYWNLLLADAQLAQQRELVSLATEQMDHTQAMFDQQQIAEDGLAASRQLLAAQDAELNRIRANQAIAAQTLLVLAGKNPAGGEEIERGILAEAVLPSHLPTGLPSELVTHRPDLAAIEADMQAARLDIQVARKALLPQFTINAQTGLAAVGLNKLFDWDSVSSQLVPGIHWDLFTGGERWGTLKVEQARYRQLIESYRSAVIHAMGDVENALVDMALHRQLLTDIKTQADAVQMIADHDYQRLNVGLVSQPQWITSELTNREYQKAVAQEQVAYLIGYASLMQALGGGVMPASTPNP